MYASTFRVISVPRTEAHIAGKILGSAYILGSQEQHLEKIYEEESKDLEKWQNSPSEVTKHDWRDFLGDPRSVH